MNIVTEIVNRIEARFQETKNPCKSYATQEAAEKAIASVAHAAAVYYGVSGGPARYIVTFIPAMGRWVGAIDQTELMNRKGFMGGYVFFIGDKGHYTF